MPLERLFRTEIRARRSGSAHTKRNSAGTKETAGVSLDDTNIKCGSGISGISGSLRRLNRPSQHVQWSSTSCLGEKNEGEKLTPRTPVSLAESRSRLHPTESSGSSESANVSVSVEQKPKRGCQIDQKSKQVSQIDQKSKQVSQIDQKSKQVSQIDQKSKQVSPSQIRCRHAAVRKKLSHFEDLSRLEYSSDGYRLTGQQRTLLKHCWKQAKSRQPDPGGYIFNWIISRYPEFKSDLDLDHVTNPNDHPRFKTHAEALSSVLELVVSSVVGEESMMGESASGGIQVMSLDDTTGPLLHSYGAKHAHMELEMNDSEEDLIQPDHWEMLKTAMCEYALSAWRQNVLAVLSASAQKRNEALHAWRILVYYIIAKLKQGYEMEKNEHKKRARGRSVAE